MGKAGEEIHPGDEGPSDADDVSFARTLLQFFVIPALVVAVCVGIFFFFTWLVSEEKSGVDYLHDIRTGSASRRWQSAFELAKLLNHPGDKARLTGLAPEMADTFRVAEDDDPRVRRYLALAMGHLGDPRTVPVLVKALGEKDPETKIYAIWALGAIGDPRAVPPLIEMAEHDDPGVRKMAVYSLGTLGAGEAQGVLRAALNDHEMDVAWNAAMALAKLGDDSGRAQILQMLDRELLGSIEAMTEDQRTEAMITAIKGAALLGDGEMRQRLLDISRQEPNLKVRQAALEALAQVEKMEEPRQAEQK